MERWERRAAKLEAKRARIQQHGRTLISVVAPAEAKRVEQVLSGKRRPRRGPRRHKR